MQTAHHHYRRHHHSLLNLKIYQFYTTKNVAPLFLS